MLLKRLCKRVDKYTFQNVLCLLQLSLLRLQVGLLQGDYIPHFCPNIRLHNGRMVASLFLPKYSCEEKNTARWLIFKSRQIPLHGAQDAENQVLHVSVSQFSRSVMSDSLQPHGLQHARPLCQSPPPRGCPNSCPLSRRCHPTISSSVVLFSSCPQSFPASGSFQMSQFFASEPKYCIRWPKYWSFSFSISPSNEYSGLIYFWID